MVRVVYFARLREALGLGQESLALPDGVQTVGEVRDWLGRRGERWRRELVESPNLCVALNMDYASNESVITDGDEVAFFPPVTGG
jgi:molybdopterin synthase sulfur carrier subunit